MPRKIAIIAGSVALAFLCGCTANDQTATRAQGAGAGAALGAGVGLLAGKDARSAIIGAGLGGFAGLVLGDTVARKKADYVSTEAMIAKEHEIVRQNADEVARYNASLRAHIDQLSVEVAALEAKAATSRDRRIQTAKLRTQAEQDLASAHQRLVGVNKELQITMALYEEAEAERSATELADWNEEIQNLEQRKRDLALLISAFEDQTQQVL